MVELPIGVLIEIWDEQINGRVWSRLNGVICRFLKNRISSSVCSEETEINKLENTIEAVDAAGISLVIGWP